MAESIDRPSAREPLLCRHLSIHGCVQGVGFRMSLCTVALRHGARGWVRNRRDGSVEALVYGPASAVEAITRWAQFGPPMARVERLLAEDVPERIDSGIPTAFEQWPSL